MKQLLHIGCLEPGVSWYDEETQHQIERHAVKIIPDCKPVFKPMRASMSDDGPRTPGTIL
jgi:hypothetical protein